MKITELLRDIILTYYQINDKFPSKIIMSLKLRRVFEDELEDLTLRYGYGINCCFMNIPLEFNINEKFVRIE